MAETDGRILCVDDNQRNLRILEELLGDDYALDCVGSGEEALAYLDAATPSLILLDLMLPGMDGLDVCRVIRDTPATAEIPIIVITAKASEEEREAGFRAGATSYLPKPFDPDELLDLVESRVPIRDLEGV